MLVLVRFNTASGKYYCNIRLVEEHQIGVSNAVSIPQAVSTIAIAESYDGYYYGHQFQYRKR